MRKLITVTLVFVLVAISTACSSHSASQTPTPWFVEVRSEAQLKHCVYQTIRISGIALRTDKGNASVDCGFEKPLEIPQISQWPRELWNHTLLITGTLRWNSPFYVDESQDPKGQTGVYPGSHPGYYYLADIQWEDLTASRKDTDAKSLGGIEEMPGAVDKLVRIEGVLTTDDQHHQVIKSKYYEFLVEEINSWPQADKGKNAIVFGVLKKRDAYTYQVNGSAVMMEPERFELQQVRWTIED